ncbi:hypothetical protein [Muricoccus radiodurans]|uniref:hypothetical protein n=1 Tax=Muricoccus radiodurans TaxID=2231721 RepID=UPI003CEB384E
MSSRDDGPPVIRLNATGGLGNRMFECLFAHRLAAEIPGAVITGTPLPQWRLRFPDLRLPRPSLFLQGHRPDLLRVKALFRDGLLRGVETNSLACRMELLPALAAARALFSPPRIEHLRFGADTLLINIRGAEILGPRHKDYRPLPFAYYTRLIDETGLQPVFMGQLGDDVHTTALRSRFRGATFEPSRGPMEDFAAIRTAPHVVLPVSTFSWLAAWLSESAETIHLPIIGFYHPRRRPEVDLIPLADPRYRFHLFPDDAWDGTEGALRQVIHGAQAGRRLVVPEAAAFVHGITWTD